jgi:PleD family two-component response regulator
MNGSVYLDSTYTGGVAFVVEIPGRQVFSRPHSPASSTDGEMSSAEFSLDEYRAFLRDLRVLVVDDSKTATKLMLRRLQSFLVIGDRYDSDMVVASTGEEALEICRADARFDLIIIDENMQPAGKYGVIACGSLQ